MEDASSLSPTPTALHFTSLRDFLPLLSEERCCLWLTLNRRHGTEARLRGPEMQQNGEGKRNSSFS